MINKLKNLLFNQNKEANSFYGGFKNTYQQTLVYVSFWNFTMLTVTAYNTTIKNWFLNQGIKLEIWYIPIFMILIMGTAMYFEYRFMEPSRQKYTWDKGMIHSKLLPAEFRKLHNRLDNIERKLDEQTK